MTCSTRSSTRIRPTLTMIMLCSIKRVILLGTLILLSTSFLSESSSSQPLQVHAAFMSTPISNDRMAQSNSKFMGRGMKLQQVSAIQRNNNKNNNKNNSSSRSQRRGSMTMFLGTDGILGVGAPEVAVTVLVGYFILGPSDLYKLVKQIGSFIQSIRTLSTEASKSFESTMEDQIDLQEMRKAQSELNNAFNFRRSINVDQQGDAFSEMPPIAENAEMMEGAAGGVAAAATSATSSIEGGTPKKKKRRRVKKKKVVNPTEGEEIPAFTGDIPDLDFSQDFKDEMKEQLLSNSSSGSGSGSTPTTRPPKITEEEEKEKLRNQRLDRLQNGQPSSPPDWYSAPESDIASEVLSQQKDADIDINNIPPPSPAQTSAEKSRFASQLSGNWNDQVLANEDQLSPLGKVMERLAILEEEKRAADARLEEEFRLRAENEEEFYRRKREMLAEASAEIAASTYNFDNNTNVESTYNFDITSEKVEVNGTATSKDTLK